MNTLLEELFEQYNIWEKDRYEISQMYALMTEDKRQSLLNSFDIFVQKMNSIDKKIIREQEILLDTILPDIEGFIHKSE